MTESELESALTEVDALDDATPLPQHVSALERLHEVLQQHLSQAED